MLFETEITITSFRLKAYLHVDEVEVLLLVLLVDVLELVDVVVVVDVVAV